MFNKESSGRAFLDTDYREFFARHLKKREYYVTKKWKQYLSTAILTTMLLSVAFLVGYNRGSSDQLNNKIHSLEKSVEEPFITEPLNNIQI